MESATGMFVSLSYLLLEGYAWGLEAAQSEGPYGQEQLDIAFRERIPQEVKDRLAEIAGEKVSLESFRKLDELVDDYPSLEDLREYLIDLLVAHSIEFGTETDPDFLEGKEWEKIETAMEDRGTELLNLLVYLEDCQANEVDPKLDDFLYEFLLVEDDDFQDEFFIYEPIVSNQESLGLEPEAIVELGNQQTGEMEELFTPLMLYFQQKGKTSKEKIQNVLQKSKIPHIHAGLLKTILGKS